MDARKWSRIRAVPIWSFVSPERLARTIIERVGGSQGMGADACTVGDVMDAIEAGRFFLPNEISGSAHTLKSFWAAMVNEGVTYLDWKWMPPRTAADLLSGLRKEQILKCDVRVLCTLTSTEVLMLAKRLGRETQGSVVPPNTVLISDLLSIGRLIRETHQYQPLPVSCAKTLQRLRELGFGPGDSALLQAA